MFGREPRLPIDLFLGGKDSSWQPQYPGEWLQGHLKRLRMAHEKAGERLQKAASTRKALHDGECSTPDLQVGDVVVVRVRYKTRCKIQDFWGERGYLVIKVPDSGGGPYTIRPGDGLDGERKVTRSEIRKLFAPLAPKPLGVKEQQPPEVGVEEETPERRYKRWQVSWPPGPAPGVPSVRGPPPVVTFLPRSTRAHDPTHHAVAQQPLRRSERQNKGVRKFVY